MELWDNIVERAPTASPEQLIEFEKELARIPDAERRLTWIVELEEHPWWEAGEETHAQSWLRLARCLETEVEAISALSAESALVREGFPAITRLELTMPPEPRQLRRALWRLSNLVELDLTRARGAGSDFEGLLNSLPPLRHLEIKFHPLPESGLLALRRSEAADGLRHLDLSSGYVPRADLDQLGALSLRSLILSGCRITAKDFRRLAGSRLAGSLLHLDLRGCPELTDWGWSTYFPSLQSCAIDSNQATRFGSHSGELVVKIADPPRHARDLLPLPSAVVAEIRAKPFHRLPPWFTYPGCWWSDPPIHVDEGQSKRCIAASVEHLLERFAHDLEGWAAVESWKVLPSSYPASPERVFAQLSSLRDVELDDCAEFEFLDLLMGLPAIESLSIRRRRVGEREAFALTCSSAARALRLLDASNVGWAKGGLSRLRDLALERLVLRNCRLSIPALNELVGGCMARGLFQLDVRGNASPPPSLLRLGIPDLIMDEP